MKPEYQKEFDALGLPLLYTANLDTVTNRYGDTVCEIYAGQISVGYEMMSAANNYHALKSAVEELREAAKETLGAWHGGTMNDVRAAMTLMEEALKETEGLV